MNRNITLAAILAVAATGAFADDITVETTPFVSTATRAQVQAELQQYRQAGVNPWSTQYNPVKSFRSARTRADVQAEYLAARDEVEALTGEDSGSFYLAQGGRTAVRTELAGQPARAQ